MNNSNFARRRIKLASRAPMFLRLVLPGLLLMCVTAVGAPILVNSTGDAGVYPNRVPTCDSDFTTPGNQCTLRAAIQTARDLPGTSTIQFQIPTTDPGYDAQTRSYTINLGLGLPNLTKAINITGPGATKLTVQRTPTATSLFRIFTVTTNGAVNISGLTIARGNFPNGAGGGILNTAGGIVTVSNCILHHNFAYAGGAVYNAGLCTVAINNSTLNDNGAYTNGGGLFNDGTMSLSGSVLRRNVAGAQFGGGVFNGGTLSLTNTTVAENRLVATDQSAVFGAGIFSGGTLTLTNCTISGNSAKGADSSDQNTNGGPAYGGGIESVDSVLNMTNCTVSGNFVEGGSSLYGIGGQALGGGIYHTGNGTFNLSNSTISANSALSGCSPMGAGNSGGGGIFKAGAGTINVKSTIIARNKTGTSAPDVSGSFASKGFNLIGTTAGSTGFTAATDRRGTTVSPLDPKLGNLQNNGGRTQTMALLTGSPAIDNGTSVGLTGNLTTDQRGAGFPRTIDDPAIANATGGDGTDTGAFELAAP